MTLVSICPDHPASRCTCTCPHGTRYPAARAPQRTTRGPLFRVGISELCPWCVLPSIALPIGFASVAIPVDDAGEGS